MNHTRICPDFLKELSSQLGVLVSLLTRAEGSKVHKKRLRRGFVQKMIFEEWRAMQSKAE
jgi:hypothetical protein